MTDLSTTAARFHERYAFPYWLRDHSRLVGAIANALAVARVAAGDRIDVETVTLAAYLHDIGRSPLLAGDPREHNELSALILAAEGVSECAEPARRHAIYTVLDPASAPRTIAEKIVYVADRRGGTKIETIEERAKDTAARHPKFADDILRAVPLALALEREIFAGLPFGPDALAAHVRVPVAG
ncbi:MAG TPA: HD domain-containing protein [Candidatus Limnocylindria bacterium]|jgi:HD superfamily phosphodiesterase